MKELSIEDRCQFRNFLRMTSSNLEDIFRMIGDRVSKKDTHMRQALSPKEKLALMQRFFDFFSLEASSLSSLLSSFCWKNGNVLFNYCI